MDENLINILAKDLGIYSYDGERIENYSGRLVYSAMAFWIKTITLDTGNLEESNLGRSKKYVLKRGTEVLNNIQELIPQCKQWFWEDYNNAKKEELHPIRILREKMLYSGEIIETDLNLSIGVPSERKESLFCGYKRLYGNLLHENDKVITSGLARLIEDEASLEQKNISVFQENFIENLIISCKWDEVLTLDEFEIFQESSKAVPYKSWGSNLTRIENGKLILGRIKLYNDYNEYYLLKKVDGKFFSYKIPEVLHEFKEERRIILKLRAEANNPMKARIERKRNVVILKLFCRLPLQEERTIETFCWPQNCLNDKNNYVVPNEIWGYITELLKSLNIEIEDGI